MIKVVAFDFGGVLGSESDDFENVFKSINKLSGISNPELHCIFDAYWPKLKIGAESVNDFWNDVVQKSNRHIAKDILEKEYESNIVVDKGMLRIVDSVKKKNYKVVLLPNETKKWMDYKIKRYKLDKIFYKIYCSAYLGISKPNKEIFMYVLNDLGIAPEELLFIDNQENNIESVRSLEIDALLFENSQKLESILKEKLGLSSN